jgi:hypothetical protein
LLENAVYRAALEMTEEKHRHFSQDSGWAGLKCVLKLHRYVSLD